MLEFLTLVNLVQVFIFIFGALAVSLQSSKDKDFRYWGGWAGLCGQPFWLYSSIIAGTWGIGILAGWYTIAYIQCIRNNK